MKMWKRVTLEAKIKVKSHAGNVEFDLAESQYDTVKLYRWLKVVSASRNIGTNDAMILYDQEVKLREMHALTQVHQSIAEFSLEFTRLNASSVCVGCPVLPPALLAHQN
jgi:hypothetical protein